MEIGHSMAGFIDLVIRSLASQWVICIADHCPCKLIIACLFVYQDIKLAKNQIVL